MILGASMLDQTHRTPDMGQDTFLRSALDTFKGKQEDDRYQRGLGLAPLGIVQGILQATQDPGIQSEARGLDFFILHRAAKESYRDRLERVGNQW